MSNLLQMSGGGQVEFEKVSENFMWVELRHQPGPVSEPVFRHEDGDDDGTAFERSDYSYPQMFIRPAGDVETLVGDQVLLLDMPPPPPAWLERYGEYLDGGGSADAEGSDRQRTQ